TCTARPWARGPSAIASCSCPCSACGTCCWSWASISRPSWAGSSMNGLRNALPLLPLRLLRTPIDPLHLLWPHGLEPGDQQAYITLEGVRDLVHSRHLRALTHLQLRLNDMGDEGCGEFVRSGILKRLRRLDLTGGRVTDAGARILAACPDLRRLEHLSLANN